MLTDAGDIRLADLASPNRLTKKQGRPIRRRVWFAAFHGARTARGWPSITVPICIRWALRCIAFLPAKCRYSKDAREIMEKQVYDEAEPLRRSNPICPNDLYIVTRLMRKKPPNAIRTRLD